ncbi:ABC transporter permease [Gryllotalpicola sp.]|uniref:ABC transporter permease n=1 Tax=Gryllotalpicola sp. TaxID=1932787 RepID=UPI0026216251|nr:ABC transporter permease [Gryllotalpicola sp.]
MNPYSQAFAWLSDAGNWAGPGGIGWRILEHLDYTGLTLALAVAIALPAGLAVGHTGRGREIVVPFTGALRALPTLGLVTVLALLVSSDLLAPLIALVILALPPIIAGAYAGVQAVDRDTVDAAKAIGFTGWQVLWRVEFPLALPLVLGGIRSACLQVIATWTVAAFLPLGGLGRFLIDGLAIRDYAQMLGGSLVVIALALAADGVFVIAQRLATPRGVRAARIPDAPTTTHQPSRKEIPWPEPSA